MESAFADSTGASPVESAFTCKSGLHTSVAAKIKRGFPTATQQSQPRPGLVVRSKHPPPRARWLNPLARDPRRVLIGDWPLPLGFDLDGRLLLARRGLQAWAGLCLIHLVRSRGLTQIHITIILLVRSRGPTQIHIRSLLCHWAGE